MAKEKTIRASPSDAMGENGLERRRAAFEHHLRARLTRLPGVPPRLAAALRYAVLGDGKRIRPLFVLVGAEAVGGDPRRALPAAVALEFVHAFSLVHDDLPAMDDDDWRRGRPTVHRRFDEATAILAGDALLAMAFEELARLPRLGLSPARALEVSRLLAEAAGAARMVAGQHLDLEAEGRPAAPSRARVERIHRRKTGDLIAAALEIGGVVGGATPGERRRLRAVGQDLGLAFQIVDDLLDERSSAVRLGKRVRADRARGKATYPAAVGVARAQRDAARLVARARARAGALGERARGLCDLAAYLGRRER
jgi:geranylgeranyl diphosphate synthase type II